MVIQWIFPGKGWGFGEGTAANAPGFEPPTETGWDARALGNAERVLGMNGFHGRIRPRPPSLDSRRGSLNSPQHVS
jgi:hypothetical protein